MMTDFAVVENFGYSLLPIRTQVPNLPPADPFRDAKFVHEDESCVETLGLFPGSVRFARQQ
jgi:hypothetical protein